MTHPGLAGKIAYVFLDSKLTPLIIAASLLLGGFAVLQTPREEEPQIIVPMIQQANQQVSAGSFAAGNVEFRVEAGSFLQTAEALGAVVAGSFGGRPVYLRDVASVEDGVEEPSHYVFFGLGPAAQHQGLHRDAASGAAYPAVTLSIAKRKADGDKSGDRRDDRQDLVRGGPRTETQPDGETDQRITEDSEQEGREEVVLDFAVGDCERGGAHSVAAERPLTRHIDAGGGR